ncbi:hypothetical protein ABW19_dt0207883 [Dactylella cylindrospora]|nr:hypothetical protein ABW19_dt0207883 [Dactylella cylindrospora]
MDGESSSKGGNAALNSGNGADFVKKLYRMLADKTHSDVVRWSDHGKSFIVFDNNDFTKNVLPQHFKHSNFASFVRQLNKYDFHKVRASEESLAGPNGDQAWEFVHPHFRLGNDNNLEGIKRKAPSQRPKKESEEPQGTGETQGMVLQLQGRLEEVIRRVDSMVQQYHDAVSEILNLNRRMHRAEEMLDKIVYFQQQGSLPPTSGPHQDGAFMAAHPPIARHEQHAPHPSNTQQLSASGMPQPPSSVSLHPAVTPIQQAERFHANRDLQQQPLSHPSHSHSNSHSFSEVNGNGPGGSVNLSGFGNTASQAGIALDATDPQISTTFRQESRRPQGLRKKSTGFVAPEWREPPKILLVEDDPTCRKIGLKFLEATGCHAFYACDGYEAIRKFNDANGPQYDLILMDIVMPNLDGVSTCQIIRNTRPDMKDPPIIAMTSNIRTSDINLYFTNGMIDVLPKPFTRDGLLQMLEKYLSRLMLHNPEPTTTAPLQSASSDGFLNSSTYTAPKREPKNSTSPILKTEYDNTTASHPDDNDEEDDDVTGHGQDTPDSSVGIAAGGLAGLNQSSQGIDGNSDYTFAEIPGSNMPSSGITSHVAGSDADILNASGNLYGSSLGNLPPTSGPQGGLSSSPRGAVRRPMEQPAHDDYADPRMKRMRFNAT